MRPWGHLAVGYFLYSPFACARFGRPPTDRATLWLAVSTQLPDLIDKPLAWRLGVLPAARTLGHSLLTITAVSVLVYAYFERRDCAHVALAFGVGYVTHPLVDGLFPLLNGQPVRRVPSLATVRTIGAAGLRHRESGGYRPRRTAGVTVRRSRAH